MKPSLSPGRRPHGAIECLEARIAPATIIIGVPNINGETNDQSRDTEYTETGSPFVNLATSTDAISNVIGHSANTYYLKLSAGDLVQRFTEQGIVDYIRVNSGKVVAFFQDRPDADGVFRGEFNSGELSGFSISDGTDLVFKDALPGDVVENLSSDGNNIFLGGLMRGVGIKNLEFRSGDITGRILSGGTIAKTSVNGVAGIYAGTGAIGQNFDFLPGAPGGEGTIATFTPVSGKAGPSINNIVADRVGEIKSGAGGFGSAGGAINNVQIVSDVDGMSIVAGDGGASNPAFGKRSGGTGGAINGLFISNQEIADLTNNNVISIKTGAGGAAASGVAGAGGAANSIYVGFRKLGPSLPVPTSNLLHDNVELLGGKGGDGFIGGKGGAISLVRITSITPNAAVPPTGNAAEIVVKSGDGGSSINPGGKQAGAGGKMVDLIIRNQALQDAVNPLTNAVLPNADILIDAGDGGSTVNPAPGAFLNRALGGVGGSVSTVKLLGSNFVVHGGNGSAGRTGGNGGGLTGITVIQENGIIARQGEFDAGFGGDGRGGKGGNGGTIDTLITNDADFTSLVINSGTSADGGKSSFGNGGNGGNVINSQLFDSDSRFGLPDFSKLQGSIVLRTGNGGDGTGIGGNGGTLMATTIVSADLTAKITTGNGGNSTFGRNGGHGGLITRFDLTSTGNLQGVPTFADVHSGNGGNGGTKTGGKAFGGAGGDITTVNINASGSGSLVAGNGGTGNGAAPGRGANIVLSGVFAGSGDIVNDLVPDSSGTLRAGNAGVTGGRPALGGSVAGLDDARLSGVFATAGITVVAGNGSFGGAGGDVKFLGYGAASQTTGSSGVPSGNILIQAGNGSVSTSGFFAGKGGSISQVSGTVTTGNSVVGAVATTVIQAGNGGGSSFKSADGGSITGLSIERGPASTDAGGVLTITAGDAGNSAGNAASARGANGGSVSGVTVIGIGDKTIFRSVSGGDAAPGTFRGGNGGSVSDIQVTNHDIGVKTGAAYGYTSMGGIFAGLGGKANRFFGAAGSVVNVTADSISSIVAGKAASPGLAEKVERITLTAGPVLPTALATSVNSTFFLTANGQQTIDLPGNALPSEVQAALNALSSVDDKIAGNGIRDGVSVVGSTSSSYQITFRNPGDQAEVVATRRIDSVATVLTPGSAIQAETQNVDLLGVGSFEFVDPINGTHSVRLPADATPQQVAQALNDSTRLPNIAAQGPITVTLGANSSYDIHFGTPSSSTPLVQAQEFNNLVVTTVSQGTATAGEVQSVNFPLLRFANPNGLAFTITGDANPVVVPGDATAAQVQAALNARASLNDGVAGNGRDGVNVSLAANNTYTIAFVNPADDAAIDINAFQQLPAHVTELADGGSTFTAAEIRPGNATTTELQHITPGQAQAPFSLSFDGQTTSLLSPNPSAETVRAALAALPNVAAAGGVTVTGDATTGYDVTFGAAGNRNNIIGTFVESQRVDVTNVGNFQLAFGSNPGLFTAPLSKNASPAQVQAQLNAIAPGLATVDPASGAEGIYYIYFNNGADQPPLTVVETSALAATQGPVITIKDPRTDSFLPVEFAAAHIVGAIADFNELDAPTFKFIDTNGDGRFSLNDGSGDVPIDGLIAAKLFNQTAPTNFTPEARFVLRTDGIPVPAGLQFFDFNNQR